MSEVTIQGVPASITRERFLEVIRLIGLDPFLVTDLRFDQMGIHATVYASEPGKPYGTRFTTDGVNVATHEIVIPVVD